jgi:hypothetical protein
MLLRVVTEQVFSCQVIGHICLIIELLAAKDNRFGAGSQISR